MLVDVICPNCETEFEAEEWVFGTCPKCGVKYGWDEEENNPSDYDLGMNFYAVICFFTDK